MPPDFRSLLLGFTNSGESNYLPATAPQAMLALIAITNDLEPNMVFG